jgi:hypothetical protein
MGYSMVSEKPGIDSIAAVQIILRVVLIILKIFQATKNYTVDDTRTTP